MERVNLIIIGLIILLFLALVYIALPLWAKVIVFIINSFCPDPIPIVDEVLMLASMMNDIIKVCKTMMIVEWIRDHKTLLIRIGIGVSLLILLTIILNKWL